MQNPYDLSFRFSVGVINPAKRDGSGELHRRDQYRWEDRQYQLVGSGSVSILDHNAESRLPVSIRSLRQAGRTQTCLLYESSTRKSTTLSGRRPVGSRGPKWFIHHFNIAEWSARRQGIAENTRITQIPLRFSATSAPACRQAGLRVEDYIKLTHYHRLHLSPN